MGAIEQQNTEKVKYLIECGVNTDCTILYAKTPLLHAIEQRYEDVAVLLMDSGADLEKAEFVASQRKPLHVATIAGSRNLSEALLARGARVDGKDGSGMTALHHACYHGHKDLVGLLLRHGASVMTSDNCSRDALHRAVEGGHFDLTDMLLRSKAAINGADRYGWTPLFQCVVCNQIDGVRFLLDRGANINMTDNKGDTPLHIACCRLSRDNVRIMLSTSVDFYRRIRKIPTCELQEMLQEEQGNDFEMVQLLVNRGADVNALNDFLARPLHLTRDTLILKFLVYCGSIIDYEMLLCMFIESMQSTWISDQFDRQLQLQRLCRKSVRSYLRHTQNIEDAVLKLPVPEKMKQYLNLSDFWDDVTSP